MNIAHFNGRRITKRSTGDLLYTDSKTLKLRTEEGNTIRKGSIVESAGTLYYYIGLNQYGLLDLRQVIKSTR